jgi:hypothetical protein
MSSDGIGDAVGSIVCGAIAFVFFPLIFGILAIVLGGRALNKNRNLGIVGVLLGTAAILMWIGIAEILPGMITMLR